MSEFTINGEPAGYSIQVAEKAADRYAAWMLQKNAELSATQARLSEATGLLTDMHDELESRGGSLTRKMWNRLETYVEALSSTPSPSPELAPLEKLFGAIPDLPLENTRAPSPEPLYCGSCGNLQERKLSESQMARPHRAAEPTLLERIEEAIRLAEGRFRLRDHGGVIHGEFYDRVKEMIRSARGAR